MLSAIKSETIYVAQATEHAVFYFIEKTIRQSGSKESRVIAKAKAGKYLHFLAVTTGNTNLGKAETGIYIVDVREIDQRANKNSTTKSLRLRYMDFSDATDNLRGFCPRYVFEAATAAGYDPMIPLQVISSMTRYLSQLDILDKAPAGSLLCGTTELFTSYMFKSKVADKVVQVVTDTFQTKKYVRTGTTERLNAHYDGLSVVCEDQLRLVVPGDSGTVLRGYVFHVDSEMLTAVLAGRELPSDLEKDLRFMASADLLYTKGSFSDGSWLV